MYPRTSTNSNRDSNGAAPNGTAADANSGHGAHTAIRPGTAGTVAIGDGVSFKGEIWNCTSLLIAGDVEGAFAAREVVVLESGRVNATIVAEQAFIRGSVTGKVIAADRVEISESGVFDGRMVYSKLSLAPGASVTGSLSKEPTAEEKEAIDNLKGVQSQSGTAGHHRPESAAPTTNGISAMSGMSGSAAFNASAGSTSSDTKP